jgi:hypothetical protein
VLFSLVQAAYSPPIHRAYTISVERIAAAMIALMDPRSLAHPCRSSRQLTSCMGSEFDAMAADMAENRDFVNQNSP